MSLYRVIDGIIYSKTKSYLMKNIVFFLVGLLLLTASTEAQRRRSSSPAATHSYDTSLYNAIEWRLVGPFRGGRSAAVTGVPGKPNLFYFGSTGGGVWRTDDGGNTWENISDGYFGGSIGAVAVSEYDPNVIFVGGGEKTVRGNVSYGYGMWKSVDAGKSWQQIGLKDSRHISRVRIHPKNPDIVYAAVMGDLYKSSEVRGVYKSTDGGITWRRTLFANPDAGAVDLLIDPNNPRVLYASTWRIRRTPYSLESGGDGSALWKSTDGGETWTNIADRPGLPKGTWGINAVAVSPVNSERVWAIIENQNGGVFRSENGGNTWRKVNDSRSLRQRAWYYTRIYADTQDEDVVYVVNVNYHRSKDGGESFESFRAPHGDHHDLWIAPEDNQRMIIGDDGGAQVSFDGGEKWSTYNNQPTAQFYRVTTDNHFPYRIYGAQQDNSTVRIAHRSDGRYITDDDWESTAGGESAHIAVDPENNDIVYGGSYGGYLTRVNHENNQARAINVWPDNPMGYGAEGMKYRFQWNFPIFFSPHDPDKLYAASNHLHATTNEGQSWEIISPDLTTNDTTKLGPSGGPITKDNTGVEYYCTIFAAIESPYEKDLLWTGSDDGLIHVSRDGGKNWKNVTPPDMPEWMMINSIDADPFNKGAAYVAGTRYKMGDYQPYLYKTEDYGNTWKKITTGFPADHFTRVVRADPDRKGLLYAGTESGMYISFDDGASWKPFQLNLPVVPITDLALKDGNLIAATQGRSFWIIDDLSPLHQLKDDIADKPAFMYTPKPTYRMGGGNGQASLTAGGNHPQGVMLYFYIRDTSSTDTLRIEFTEQDGTLIQAFSTHPDREKKESRLSVKRGMNMVRWDMEYPGATTFDGMILWWGNTGGPSAVPGEYRAHFTGFGLEQEVMFEILRDPRSEVTVDQMQEQFDFLIEIRDKLSEAHQAIIDIRDIRSRINALTRDLDEDEYEELKELAKEINKVMSEVEKNLYQTKNRSGQDPLNFPIKLTNKLAHVSSLVAIDDYPPTAQDRAVKEEMEQKIDEELAKFYKVRDEEIPRFNELVIEKKVPLIQLEKTEN